MSYQAPVKDMLFCMTELAGLEQVARLPGFEEAGVDTARRCWRNAPASTRACSCR